MPAKPRINPRETVSFNAIMGIGCLAAVVYMVASISESRQAWEARALWVTVDGQLTAAEVVEVRGKRKKFWPMLHYEYSVAGQSFQGREWAPGPAVTSVEVAQQAAQAYSVGQAVPVHVDPEAPAQSLLDRDVGKPDDGDLVVAAVPLAFSLMFLGKLWVLLRRRKAKTSSPVPIAGG